MKKNSKKVLMMGILVVIMIVVVTGVSLAFFNYTRTGNPNTLQVGRISFNTNQTETINLSNIFPIDVTNGIPNDDTKVGTFELEITGDTDYVGGIEYLVSAVNTHVTTSTGQIVPISLDVAVEGLGDSNSNYFTERDSRDSKIYKRLSGNGIMGDGNLLVGYIPQNTTLGTPGGINGKITIKAYLDASKIAISDTYDGNETDLMGTTTEWVEDRVVLTTDEWNALQSNGISFQIKVEANEDIWVEETLYDVVERQTVMDNIQSTYVSSSTGIDFSQISSDTNGKGVYTFSSTANDAYPVMYYRGAVDNNNVLFANKCWKMIRTTDTGGVKLIYNGENKGTSETPNCDNTGADTQITLNIDGEDVNSFKFNINSNSPAYVGYMYGTVYSIANEPTANGVYFGNSFTYDSTNNLYTLTDAKVGIDEYHHYTCNEVNASTTCTNIRYYFASYIRTSNSRTYYLYITLDGGKNIEEALKEMQENNNDSNAKTMIDSWYEDNIDDTGYENKLEDTIYCNDRRTNGMGGFDPNGGLISESSSGLSYIGLNIGLNEVLKCSNRNDAFTLPNGRGNGALDYPIALITFDEIKMAGYSYLVTGQTYWTMSPNMFNIRGISTEIQSSSVAGGAEVALSRGLRPVISLKNSTAIVDNAADGTVSNPYIIK